MFWGGLPPALTVGMGTIREFSLNPTRRDCLQSTILQNTEGENVS